MNPNKLTIPALLVAAALSGSARAEPVDYTNHALARVWVDTFADIELLKEISPDIWTEHILMGRPVFARIPPNQLSSLETSGLSFDIVDDDCLTF